MKLFLTGERFDGQQAVDMVAHVAVPEDQLISSVEEQTRSIWWTHCCSRVQAARRVPQLSIKEGFQRNRRVERTYVSIGRRRRGMASFRESANR